MKIGSIKFDEINRVLMRDGQEVNLTGGEAGILKLLMLSRGQTKTREEICLSALGYSSEVTTRTVDQHVHRLRRKLGPEAGRIVTVQGVGYRLV